MGTCINCEGSYAETPDYQRFNLYRSDLDTEGFVCSPECLKAVAEKLLREEKRHNRYIDSVSRLNL